MWSSFDLFVVVIDVRKSFQFLYGFYHVLIFCYLFRLADDSVILICLEGKTLA